MQSDSTLPRQLDPDLTSVCKAADPQLDWNRIPFVKPRNRFNSDCRPWLGLPWNINQPLFQSHRCSFLPLTPDRRPACLGRRLVELQLMQLMLQVFAASFRSRTLAPRSRSRKIWLLWLDTRVTEAHPSSLSLHVVEATEASLSRDGGPILPPSPRCWRPRRPPQPGAL